MLATSAAVIASKVPLTKTVVSTVLRLVWVTLKTMVPLLVPSTAAGSVAAMETNGLSPNLSVGLAPVGASILSFGSVRLSSKIVALALALAVSTVALTASLMPTLKFSDCSKTVSSTAVKVMTGALSEPAGIFTLTPVVKKLAIWAGLLRVTGWPVVASV